MNNDKRPNRKKAKQNPYTIYRKNGQAYLKFKDGMGKKHKLKISEELYEAFDRFEKDDERQMKSDSRHVERLDKMENALREESLYKRERMEEIIFRKIQLEELHNALDQPPEKQRRRLILYYFNDYSYKEIAEMEGCSIPVVSKSIDAAKRNIKAIMGMR